MRRRPERQNLKDIPDGQHKNCEAIICRHYKSIYSFMVYLTGDKNLAEDLTQETFVSAWANIDNFEGHASSKTWLHRIAYHKFIDSRRQLKRYTALMSDLKKQVHNVPEPENPLSQIISNENRRFLYEAIQKLESPEYVLIVLHYFQGLSFREMTKVLDKPTGTVKWRTSKALKQLK